jgi:putative endonuclease
MPAYVYVLRSAVTGQHFIGSTNNLQDRIARHNTTINLRTSRPGGPWECVYVEVCDNLDSARTRERYLKSLDGVDEKIRILYTTPWRDKKK